MLLTDVLIVFELLTGIRVEPILLEIRGLGCEGGAELHVVLAILGLVVVRLLVIERQALRLVHKRVFVGSSLRHRDGIHSSSRVDGRQVVGYALSDSRLLRRWLGVERPAVDERFCRSRTVYDRRRRMYR